MQINNDLTFAQHEDVVFLNQHEEFCDCQIASVTIKLYLAK